MPVFSDTICQLGEGPLWHPTRAQFFWFDILGKRLLTKVDGDESHWQFDSHFSAAGWVDVDTLFLASERAFWTFDIPSGKLTELAALEADNPITRSNDGRADPFGGFWIGTMGKQSEPRAGRIWRYYKGEVRELFNGITVSNSICFSPDGTTAYFADTLNSRIAQVRLDPKDGWPVGAPTPFVDVKAERLFPDGSVVDAEGNLWNAQWGAARVACYGWDGQLKDTIDFAAKQISCPAFGGPGLATLYATSAAVGVEGPEDGKTFFATPGVTGQAEHQVLL